MARAIDILTLERVKMELEITSVAVEHDALLAMQIAAAVDYVSEVAGIDYASADYDATSFPPGLVAVCAMMTRAPLRWPGRDPGAVNHRRHDPALHLVCVNRWRIAMADEHTIEVTPDMLRAVSMFLTLSRIEPESMIAALAYLRAANDGWTVPEMRARLHRLIDGLQVDEAALAELAESFNEAHVAADMRERQGATLQ